MADSQPSTPRKVESRRGAQTVVVHEIENAEGPPVLQLRLQQPRNEHRVQWTTDTVDNELLGKKSSKCCCIYEKPKVFGESSSSSSDEDDDDNHNDCTPHCRGHKKKCYKKRPHNAPQDPETETKSS